MVAQQGTGKRLSSAITIGLSGYLQNASYRLKTQGNFLLPYICVQGHILYIPTVVHLRTPVRLCLKLLEHLGLSSKAVLGLATGYAQRKGKETHWHIPRRGTIQIASSPYPITSHHIHTIPHPIISHLCCVLACMLGLDILWRTLAWLQKNINNFIPRPRCIKPGAYRAYLQNAPSN